MYFISLRKCADSDASRGFHAFIDALKDEAIDSISKLRSLLGDGAGAVQVMLTSHEFLYGNLQGGQDYGGYASEEEKNIFELEMQALVESLTAEYHFDICLAPGTISFAKKSTDSDKLRFYTRAYLFIARQPIQFKDKTKEGHYKLLSWGEKQIFVSICYDFSSFRYGIGRIPEVPDIYYIPSYGLNSPIDTCPDHELNVKTGTVFVSDDGMFSHNVEVYEVMEALSKPTLISLTKENKHRFSDAISLKEHTGISIFCLPSKTPFELLAVESLNFTPQWFLKGQGFFLNKKIQILPTDPIVKIHQHILLAQTNLRFTDTTPYQNKTFCINVYNNKHEFLFSLDIAYDDKRTLARLFKKTPKIREIVLKNSNLHFAVMGLKEPGAPLTITISDTLGYSREIRRVMNPVFQINMRCALMWANRDCDSGFTATRLSLLFQGKQDLGIEFSTRENFIQMVERLHKQSSTDPELKSLIQKVFECALINTDDLEAWKLAFSTSTVDPLEEPHFKLISYVHSINFDLYEIDPSGEESFYCTMKCSFSARPAATVSLTYLAALWMRFSDALVIGPTTADIDLIEIINQDYMDSPKAVESLNCITLEWCLDLDFGQITCAA